MKWAAAVAAKVDGSPGSLQALATFVDNRSVDFRRLCGGPGPKDGLAGLGNPPINLIKGRKETRKKDAHGTEGGGKRKKKHVDSHGTAGGGDTSKKINGNNGTSTTVMNALSSFSAGLRECVGWVYDFFFFRRGAHKSNLQSALVLWCQGALLFGFLFFW